MDFWTLFSIFLMSFSPSHCAVYIVSVCCTTDWLSGLSLWLPNLKSQPNASLSLQVWHDDAVSKDILEFNPLISKELVYRSRWNSITLTTAHISNQFDCIYLVQTMFKGLKAWWYLGHFCVLGYGLGKMEISNIWVTVKSSLVGFILVGITHEYWEDCDAGISTDIHS